MQRFKGRAFDPEVFEPKFFREKSKGSAILLTKFNLSALDNFHKSSNGRDRNLRSNCIFVCTEGLVGKAKLTEKPSFDWEDFPRGFEVESRFHGMAGFPSDDRPQCFSVKHER
jgi:hypothetical protein